MKRYQVYLDPHSVGILDEGAETLPLNRSQIIREAIAGAATRVGNLLAILKPTPPSDYSVWDEMIGAFEIKGQKVSYSSENVDEIYYR